MVDVARLQPAGAPRQANDRAGDPVGAFSLTDECYQAVGEQLAALSVPILAVQEGGYDLEGLGKAVVALVDGLAPS